MHTSDVQVIPDGHAAPPAHEGRAHVVPPHTYGAGQGVVLLHVRIAQRPVVVQRSAPPQSASTEQSRTQAPKFPQVVVPGQSDCEPQPLHTPPDRKSVV